MAEKSLVNEFAETLGVAAPDELAAALEVALELLDDELPHPTAIADATAIRANARNRRENKLHAPLSLRRFRAPFLPSQRAEAISVDTVTESLAAVHAA
jgi:hypothetical protein